MLVVIGITSLDISRPVLSLILVCVLENQALASDSKPLKSRMQSSSPTSLGSTSSPLDFLTLPPEPNTSSVMLRSVPLTVSGWVGLFSIPVSAMLAEAISAEPNPAPSDGLAQIP